jgi:transcriptional regulator with XRE-family HTH domain
MHSEDNILIHFGRKVREFRKKKKLSQEAFALQCGLDRTYISDVELGKRNISLKNINLIASNLGVMISDLFDQ